MSKTCIVCGRRIAKRTERFYFREPRSYRAPVERSYGGWYAAQEEKPDGFREGDTIYLANRPKTKDEAQRYVNGKIISLSRNGDEISHVNHWDGESYVSKYFCTNTCAIDQGYASAHHGARFTWKAKK